MVHPHERPANKNMEENNTMNLSSHGSNAKLAHLTKPVLSSDVICDDLSLYARV